MTSLFVKIQLFLSNLRDEERGQDLIEYALFGGLLATLIIAASVFLLVPANNPLLSLMSGIEGCVDFQAGGCTPF